MEQPRWSRGWAYAGVLSAVLLLPVMHLAAVDVEDKTANEAEYLRHVNDRYLSTALAGGVGLVLTALLIVYLAGLRRTALPGRPLLADASIAIGGLAVVGLAIGFAASIMTAYGAHEHFPFPAVRSTGLIAENLAAILLPALAGPAVLISVQALRGKSLPRFLGYVAALFAVVLTVLGVVLPGAGAIPAVLWLLISAVTLSLKHHRSQALREEERSPSL